MELTIIKKDDGAYIDSREVAEAIGKKHQHLLRDIRGYAGILEKGGLSKLGQSDFFVESVYFNAQNKPTPCYLLTKSGCELVANKLIGEKGVLFTAAYVTRFRQMEENERKRLAAQAVTPKLAVFNTAVRNVLNGMSYSDASPKTVMDFLRSAYKPFGVAVKDSGDESEYYSASVIASALNMYSDSGRPHAQAVSADIAKLDFDPEGHIEIVPYGLVGFSVRYDEYVAQGVEDWIEQRGYPRSIPHNGIKYHVHYKKPRYLFKYDCDACLSTEIDLDDDDFWDYE